MPSVYPRRSTAIALKCHLDLIMDAQRGRGRRFSGRGPQRPAHPPVLRFSNPKNLCLSRSRHATSLSQHALTLNNCHNRPATPRATLARQDGGVELNRGARLSAEHHRDMAAHFRALAEAEPLASLRRHLRRLAMEHDEASVELEASASEHPVPEDT